MSSSQRGLLDNPPNMSNNENGSSRASYANRAADASLATLPYHHIHTEAAATNTNTNNTPPSRDKTKTGMESEHGHSLSMIEPMSKHSGASVVTFFNGLFQTILGIGTLGASITFSYVLSNSNQQLSTPISEPHFTTQQIQLFLSISWLLFLLALAFASLGSTMLTFFRTHWQDDWDGLHGKTSQFQVQLYAVGASAVLGGLVIGAFVLLCLVVVAYSPIVGWIALGFTGFFGIIIFIAILNQAPWPWQNNNPRAIRQRTV